ncbi:fused MFS/spermidine synthase [Sphingosinicella sp.]|uniref:fused MFS/spermidine synthase n=1 Tax=Sphingosinicella sp. TaxID=1917971 RepID=UPI0040379ADC
MATDTTERRGPARVDERYARPLFILTIVTGSFLLFLTQPMIARMALPRIGGAPSVWNSAMLVYQALLLAGYAYAHWVSKIRPRKQVGVHIVLLGLAALWLPIGLSGAIPPADGSPFFWVPWFLLASIGPVFFIVSAQAPLMQRWYALETSRGDPYPLYAASNLGSFAGLISYPLIVEPLMSLNQQSWLWTAIYVFLVLLVVGCALTVPADAVEVVPEEESAPPTTKQYLHWILLAAVPSGLMLSTTTHLTTDIVAMPLLWVMPLGLYLLSFVVAFAERRRPTELVTIVAPLIILIAGGLAFSDGSRNPFVSASLGLFLLLVVAIALHGEMFRLRPSVGHLTKFYLAMSFGGMLGGLFCAIVAPLVFDWAYEHPVLILAAALLVPQSPLVPWPRRLIHVLGAAIPALAILLSFASERGWFGYGPGAAMLGSIFVSLLALACLGRRVPFMVALAALMLSYGGWSTLARSAGDSRTRSYFGIYDVYNRPDGSARVLTHGTTLHGIQNLTPGLETVPTSYYARRSGVGLTLANANAIFGRPARVGFVGLGSGTLSCYHQAGQQWTIYEIDPQMVEVARNRFTFLSRCAPDARIVLGDARINLRERTPANSIDVLAVDAFTSDAVPMHLLTREALAEYGRAVQRDGIVLFHISNRYLDLKPVVADIAATGGWASAMMVYQPTTEEADLNATISVWIALSRNPETLRRVIEASGEDGPNWEALDPTPGFAGWTDDHASILPILNYPSWVPFLGRR